MIHQALADALESHQDRNAQILQLPDRTDTGAEQMRRRMNGSAGEHDFAAAEFHLVPVDQRLYADAARAVEQKLLDLRVGRDREIGALSRLAVEIAHRRRDALLVLIGVRDRKITVDELAVLVGQERKARQLAGLGDGLRMCRPVRLRDTADRNAAVLSVVRPIEIEIALDLPEIGQHALPVPPRSASRLPLVIVGRRAAIGELAVDRGAAAQDARLLVFAQGRPFLRIVMADDLGRNLEFGPVEARIEIGRARIAVPDLGGFIAGRRILSGFAEQDLVGTLGGEPVGQDRSRRPSTDDDEIVHAGASPVLISEGNSPPSSGHARLCAGLMVARRGRLSWHAALEIPVVRWAAARSLGAALPSPAEDAGRNVDRSSKIADRQTVDARADGRHYSCRRRVLCKETRMVAIWQVGCEVSQITAR